MLIRKIRDDDRQVLTDMARKILEPLYGCQNKAIDEWFTGRGHKQAFVLEIDGKIAGFLNLKADSSKPYLKISTLLVFKNFAGRGCGHELIKKAFQMAYINHCLSLIVTVSDSKPESLSFFQKYGFQIIDQVKGKYRPTSVEFILERKLSQ